MVFSTRMIPSAVISGLTHRVGGFVLNQHACNSAFEDGIYLDLAIKMSFVLNEISIF